MLSKCLITKINVLSNRAPAFEDKLYLNLPSTLFTQKFQSSFQPEPQPPPQVSESYPPKLILEVNTMSVFKSQLFPFLCPALLGLCWAWAVQSQNLALFSCILDQLALKILYPSLFFHLATQFWILTQALKQMSLKSRRTTQKRTQMWELILRIGCQNSSSSTSPTPGVKIEQEILKSQTL